jgi:tetratricopeptide (TPR) repeat protein
VIVLGVMCALVAPRAARAEPTPWAAGVSKSNQTRALELFKKGNGFFEETKYTDALAEYEKALKLWDHPNIQYNLTICLIQIRQPLEAWDHLEKALRFGEAPLGKRLYGEAMNYRALLESSLAQLSVKTEQDEVEVMLDGKQLKVNRKKPLHLLAGTHQLVATLDGYQTESRALDLPAGKLTEETIELQPEVVKVKIKKVRENYERRWGWWVPWATAGSAVALALIGTGVYVAARSDMQTYDDALAKQCPMGCHPSEIPASLSAQEQHASHLSTVAIGLWSAGAAVGVVAGVMAILNRPRLAERRPDVSVVAVPGYVGVGVALSFQ